MIIDIKTFSELSFKNRSKIDPDKNVSCYYCGKVYLGKEIKEWADDGEDTAICPYCWIDSVVPFEVDRKTLNEATRYYFSCYGGDENEMG